MATTERKVNFFDVKGLGQGFLPITKTTLYTSPVLAATIVKTITIVNTTSTDKTLNVYINRDGGSYRITPKDTILRPGYLIVIDQEYTLEPNHYIEADCEAADACEYTISGITYTND